MGKKVNKYKKLKVMFSFDVKSNILDFSQKINVTKFDNIYFNESLFSNSIEINIGYSQFLDYVINGNYYACEILIQLNNITFKEDIINNLIDVIFKICLFNIKTNRLCNSMIAYIKKSENRYINYTLMKLSYIISGKILALNIKTKDIDYEIKNKEDLLNFKDKIIYTYDKYKKNDNTTHNKEYTFLKDELSNFINQRIVA